MIGISVAHLVVVNIRLRVALYEVVVAPADIVEYVLELTAFLVSVPVLIDRPCKQRGSVGHGEVELHVVARVKKSAGKIQPVVLTVIQTGISAPVAAEVIRELAGAL